MFKTDRDSTYEAIKKSIYNNLERNPLLENLDLHEKIFIEKTNLNDLYNFELSPLATKLEFVRDENTGELKGYEEVSLECGPQEQNDVDEVKFYERPTNANSLSMNRMPALDRRVRGNSEFFPFKPAALKFKMERELYFERIAGKTEHNSDGSSTGGQTKDVIEFDDFLYKPDKFESGLVNNQLTDDVKKMFTWSEQINDELLNDIDQFKKESVIRKRKKDENNEEQKKLRAAVVNISIKDFKDVNYYDTKFVKVLDSEEKISEEEFRKLLPNPAKSYLFELDTFQKKAILCLEKKQNVLVVAHTSAGKTVVAEYAISLSFRNCTRTVYTSPIKALSNQKYRDFRLSYGSNNVGLLTGDIQLNQDAPCLIMTTEILLQMLYNGSELIRDLEWVVLDEVHYINDRERGHVYEEIFILLPDHVNLVLLSATVSNVNEFGDWLGKARNKITHIVFTKNRPVPLQHFLYLGSDGRTEQFFEIINQNEQFNTIQYKKAVDFYKEREKKRTSGQQRNKMKSGAAGAKTRTLKPNNNPNLKSPVDPTTKNMFIGMIRHLQKTDKLPLIIFTFSRQKCNEYASVLWQAMDLCKNRERSRIHMFINNSLQKLKRSDRDLPQVIEVSNMLKNGFGIHHSGILPLLREICEHLFTLGFVKVLVVCNYDSFFDDNFMNDLNFKLALPLYGGILPSITSLLHLIEKLKSTETFALGINMPAKSVAFDSMEKHDGHSIRELLPSEYIQMAGRAGRRGKDDTGTVIIICKDGVPDFSTLAKSISNKVSPLESKFRLTYSMILNILRVRHHLRIESMMEKSFVEHKIQQKFNEWVQDKERMENDLKMVSIPDCSLCKLDLDLFSFELVNYIKQRSVVMKEFCERAILTKKLIESGTLLIYGTIDQPFYIGVVLRFRPCPVIANTELRIIGFNPLDLINHMGKLSKIDSKIEFISLDKIDMITKLIISDLKVPNENDPHESEDCNRICEQVYEMLNSFNHELPISSIESLFFIPSYNPAKDMKMNEMNYILKFNSFLSFRTNLLQKQCLACSDFYEHYKLSARKIDLENCLEEITRNLSCENLQFLPDYRKRLAILNELGYIDNEGVLTMKGKVACLISENELVITELLVNNFLHDLSPQEIAAVMSSFMFQQKHALKELNSENLAKKIIEIKRVAIDLDKVQHKYGITMNSCEILDSLNFGLVQVVYEWARGMPFSHLMHLTKVQESIIVKCIQRTDELLKDIIAAAKLIGDIELISKLQQSSKCIRRDIVFSVSLYVQDTLNFRR